MARLEEKVTERLGVWADDPRSVAGADAIRAASEYRQTMLGRLEKRVGAPRTPQPMEPGQEYRV
ncbi:MAG: hypothetical protein ABSE17_02505 [Candidatus Levyibacteriota bacterium]|jgi:hypothetical protein